MGQFLDNIVILEPEPLAFPLVLSILVIMEFLDAVHQSIILFGMIGLEKVLLLLGPVVYAFMLLL